MSHDDMFLGWVRRLAGSQVQILSFGPILGIWQILGFGPISGCPFGFGQFFCVFNLLGLVVPWILAGVSMEGMLESYRF